jgi:hypothetical protein
MKYPFYTQHSLSVSLTLFEAIEYEGQNALWFLLYEEAFHE